MRVTIFLIILLVSIPGFAKSEESDIGFWKSEDCKKTSEAAGFYLHASGELLKTAGEEKEIGNEEQSDELYQAALFFSELSANAAQNFQTFCKR